MPNKTAILRVRLTEEQLTKLIKYAKQQKTTRSKLITKFMV